MTDDITALVAEKCWQPIKTAPKDGETIVDLWFPPCLDAGQIGVGIVSVGIGAVFR
jgi:hypothetical protein